VRIGMLALMASLQLVLMIHGWMFLTNVIHVTRNFYGTLRVAEDYREDPIRHRFSLLHGRIKHGCQLTAPEQRPKPTTYYGEHSGMGLALLHNARHARGGHLRVGVIGLGVGTVAAYARPGDEIRFYEINPAVTRIAGDARWFTYLRDCAGAVSVVEGDGRISLERECRLHAAPFDVLVLDAFSGDAVPMHLLTLEAFEIYFQRLRRPDGLLAVNVSNRYLDLEPVVAAAAMALDRQVATVSYDPPDDRYSPSTWMILSAGAPFAHAIEGVMDDEASEDGRIVLWTDDFSNLLGVIK
jgi:spermidine synthase